MIINFGKFQFILLIISTAFETYFFNESWLEGSYLFTGFWLFILYRNLRTAWALSRFARAMDKPKK